MAPHPLTIVSMVVSLSTAIQTTELIVLRESFADNGIWRWTTLRREFEEVSEPVRKLLDIVLGYRGFLLLLVCRLLASALLATSVSLSLDPSLALIGTVVLLFSTLAIGVRWRGTFNGGSDYMTIVVLTGLTVSAALPYSPSAALAGLAYIAFHSINSYFVAGAVKLGSPDWRTGRALSAFVRSGSYAVWPNADRLLSSPIIGVALCWATILFEIAFPVVLLNQSVCLVFLVIGGVFHLANVYVFGLNRFFWAWTSTYPAIYWCSGFLGSK
jgi:hypothetical protein